MQYSKLRNDAKFRKNKILVIYSIRLLQLTFSFQVNLVCDDALLVSLAQTIFYAGVLVGNIVLGQVSDL